MMKSQESLIGIRLLTIVLLIIPAFCFAQSNFQYIAVKDNNNKWGFINEKYEIIIPFMYDDAQDFKSNSAWVKLNNEFHCIRPDNDIVFSVKFEEVFPFNEGLARFKQNNKFGFINRLGKVIVQAVYDNASDYSEGLARVKKGGYWGFIDYNCNLVIDFNYLNASDFSDGYAVVENKHFIDKKGNLLLENKKFNKVMPFSEGLAAVSVSFPYLFGYIDTSGKLIIAFQYEEANLFSEGLAAVKAVGKTYVYINKEGKSATKYEYSVANEFREGVALVAISIHDEKSGKILKYGYINHKGKYLFPPKTFNSAGPFRNGIARVVFNQKEVLIDKHGRCIFYCQ